MHIFLLQDSVDVGMLANLFKWSNFPHIRRAALQNQNHIQVYSCYLHQFLLILVKYFSQKQRFIDSTSMHLLY